MLLQHVSPEIVHVKLAQSVIVMKHDGSLRIGDRDIEGPGEYDVAGVGVHVFASYALFFTEGLRLAVVWGPTESMGDEDASSDIYIFLLPDIKQITSLIKEEDPRLVVLHDATIAQQLQEQDALPIEQQPSYKVTAQTLPAGDRVIIHLG